MKAKQRFGIFLGLILLLGIGGTMAPVSASHPQNADSLYKRLGGYDAVAAVTDDFLNRIATDKQLGRFFVGTSKDSQKRIRQHVVDQLCAATGGPCMYTGRSMKIVHDGLGITEDDWDVAVKHLVATLDKFKVQKRERDELLGALNGLKADIVKK